MSRVIPRVKVSQTGNRNAFGKSINRIGPMTVLTQAREASLPLEKPLSLKVAIVIPCHNYARFASEAIESALKQTKMPTQVIVIDDASTDNILSVVERFKPYNVRYRRIIANSVWEARKAGFNATTSDVLCFLDADDKLPPDYLELGLPLFKSNQVGIVYSDMEQFGERTGRMEYQSFSRSDLENDNFMHAGSLVRRKAIEISRGFGGPVPLNPHADWNLWRRVCEAGFVAEKQKAIYHYRRHKESMSLTKVITTYYDYANLKNQNITIVCPLSGRSWAWEGYKDWLDRQEWSRKQCSILIIDSGPTPDVRDWISTCNYPDVRYLKFIPGEKGLADLPRQGNATAVRLAMSRIYNKMSRSVTTPFIFVLEDDILPKYNAIDLLMRAMDKDVAAVTGAYKSRYADNYIAWKTLNQHLNLVGGKGIEDIDGCGFGCLLIRRAILEKETFASLPDEHPDYDIAFFHRVRQSQWKIRINWEVKAQHLSPPGV